MNNNINIQEISQLLGERDLTIFFLNREIESIKREHQDTLVTKDREIFDLRKELKDKNG